MWHIEENIELYMVVPQLMQQPSPSHRHASVQSRGRRGA